MNKTTVYTKSTILNDALAQVKASGKSIGFVPTMGALHEGHLALIRRAKKECDVVIVSIFVNPTQFNNSVDLEKYPRDLEKDIDLLDQVGQVFVFAPTIEEVYTDKDNFPGVELNGLDKVLEGEFRPGHFQGVVHVVYNLFSIVSPDKAYFGLKDFQQVVIIKKMVQQLKLPVEIITCPTLREKSGLAMSSRNMRLSQEEKKDALIIPNTLNYVKELVSSFTPSEAKEKAIAFFKLDKLELEYLEIIDGNTLLPLEDEWKVGAVCCIAAFCGSVRLIDNMQLK